MVNFIRYNKNLKNVARDMRKNQTSAEKEMWDFLRMYYKQHHFMRQKVLDNFIADFYSSKLQLIIEVDGDVHLEQTEKDKERDSYFKAKYQITTIRFSNHDILNDKSKVKTVIDSFCYSKNTP